MGVGGQAAPPPTYQCPPLSGRSWPPLPPGEKALFSFPATGGEGGEGGEGGWWVLDRGRLVIKAGWEPALSSPPPLSLSGPCRLEGREAFGVPEGYVSLGAPCH